MRARSSIATYACVAALFVTIPRDGLSGETEAIKGDSQPAVVRVLTDAFGAGIRFDQSRHPAAVLVRELAAPGLVRRDAAGSFVPAAATSMMLDTKSGTWTALIAPGAAFSNGAPIAAVDILHSFAACGIRSITVSDHHGGLEVRGESVAARDLRTVFEIAGLCPIVSKAIGDDFGPEFGHGTAYIGAGTWVVTHVEPKRLIVLERAPPPNEPLPNDAPPLPTRRIEIRPFASAGEALDRLVAGRADFVAASEDPVLDARVSRDETLLKKNCAGTTLITRRDSRLPCPAEME